MQVYLQTAHSSCVTGLVALAQPEPGGWHEITVWVLLIGSFVLISYVVIVDLENIWQNRRARRLRSCAHLALAPAIWELGAFDALLIDWLETAPPVELQTFRALDGHFMRALFAGASPHALYPRYFLHRWHLKLRAKRDQVRRSDTK